MTDRHVSWLMFTVSLVIGAVFLSVLVKVNIQLDQQRQAFDVQQKQLDRLTEQHHAMQEQILKMLHTDDTLAHDIDVTQELQRKQAIEVGDLKKGRKK